MVKFTMMVGVSGSEKSVYARELAKREGAVYLSSDDIRQELLGTVARQDENPKVFDKMNRRLLRELEAGHSVVYDATNLSARCRKAILHKIPAMVETECVVFVVTLAGCLQRNRASGHSIRESVIKRQFTQLQLPSQAEGWNHIRYRYEPGMEPAAIWKKVNAARHAKPPKRK